VGYSEKWKVLENMMVDLRKRGVSVSPEIVNDLRSAKLMMKIVDSEGSKGDATQKLEECLGSVESYLVTEAEKILSTKIVDDWLRRLDESAVQTCEVKPAAENKFITGVPRDQKWLRIEPMPSLPAERVQEIAKENRLSTTKQSDGRLVVYGQQGDLQAFLKKMADEAAKKR
jgi:hypothetical protein